MKTHIRFVFLFVFVLLFLSCEEVTRITGVRILDAFAADSVTVYLRAEITDLSWKDHDGYGFCYDTFNAPTVNGNKFAFSGSAVLGVFGGLFMNIDLSQNVYVRAYVREGNEYIYSPAVLIDKSRYGTFIDPRDGRVYKTIQIGTQRWMAENLNYRPTTGNSWYYDNDSAAYSATYGRLYDWNTALTVAPPGWHLPSDAEWTTLITYLGGESVAGGKLKEAGTAHWASPNAGADNSRGFTALPSGCRYYNGTFNSIGYYGLWWSSTELNTTYAWYRGMYYDRTNVFRDYDNKGYGFSIRCVRD